MHCMIRQYDRQYQRRGHSHPIYITKSPTYSYDKIMTSAASKKDDDERSIKSDDDATASTGSTAAQQPNTRRTKRRRTSSRKRRQLLETTGDQPTHLYRVDWQAQERGIPQQSLPLVAILPASQQQPQQPQQQTQLAQNSIAAVPVLRPPSELSLRDVNPLPETIWSYTVFLGVSVTFWILYLLLPRGYRKRFCNANRKRYARRTEVDMKNMPPTGYWLPANQTMSDAGGAGGSQASFPQRGLHPHQGLAPPLLQSTSTMSSLIGGVEQPAMMRTPQNHNPMMTNTPKSQSSSSPDHPALKKIPPNKIIAETMGRLQGRGIRLVAHGVHCDPKRVWIKLDDDTKSVTWQTEFPRRVPNQSGQVSIVLMRGSVHRIALTNVLYIDVGKKTSALQRLDEIKVPDPSCFSLLTQNGSLDLQANSKLERDALVSCFSMILDDVHANEDWRALYEASPDPSLANSSVGNGMNGDGDGGGGGGVHRMTSSGERRPPAANNNTGSGSSSRLNYPNPSDLLIEV